MAGMNVPPLSGSSYADPDREDWQPTDAAGFWIKPLYDNPARGERTCLMKVDPGAFYPVHDHPGEWEQIYVLQGAFYDDQRELRAGAYACRAPGAPHLSGSKEGAMVLLVYSRETSASA
jgi:quercetin dioxygenase-like cupin family protein